ncbi:MULTISPECIES: DUF4268 domain-containing protein [Bacillota]|uniref:DUF262 domain-containing protein n=1 Tax=Anaerotignum neopropionicum TaxID=36847 RepID=A0A136WGG8_9FIRM|nr:MULTISPECIES: DUF4268 domain-containing protein [Bacillota]KXL53605.1 hypothetical protein CLNEO_08310 [Anaerotignum neopropionicum]WSI03056.1 DUF4268 domain-containing protein [Sedimentibacter sp. MB36-C1]
MNNLESISQIFQNKIFRIPDYQRGYAWRKEQLIDFWDDIMNLQMDRYHYTGLLSLKELNRKSTERWNNDLWLLDSGYKACHVVDGQQRLTTISILLNEIINFIKAIDENKDKNDEEIVLAYETIKDIRTKYISRKQPPHNIITTYLFGYEEDNPSFEYLQYKVFGQQFSKSIQETYYTKNLKYAKEFFWNCLSQLYEDEGLEGIEKIYKKLTQKLMFNIHEIEDDYDVFVAFETMNNRGKKLTNLELLKNRLIYLTTLFDHNKLDEYNKNALRKKINDAWKEVYYQLGRNKKVSLSDDEFLRAHWIMFFQYSRQKGNDYIKFLLNRFSAKNVFEKQIIPIVEETSEEIMDLDSDEDIITDEEVVAIAKLEPSDIDTYVLSLNETAKYWYYTFFPNESNLTDDEKIWLDKLNRVGIGYFRPLVTSAITPSSKSTSIERVELFKQIERFIFVCFRMGTFQSSYKSSDYYRKAKDVYAGVISINEVANDLKTTTDNDIKAAINNFMTRIDKRFDNGDGFYGWKDLKYLLYEYEYSLAVKGNIEKLDWNLFTKTEKDKLTIEHILPQTPSKWYWKNQFRKYTDAEIKILSSSIGNLLPLAQSINSSLQNDSFDDKKTSNSAGRRGYENGSHSEIEVSKEDDWSDMHIYNRGLKLLSFMEGRWMFKFAGNEQKSELLHINFIFDEREEVPEVPEFTEIKVTPAFNKDINVSNTQQLRLAFWTGFVDYCKSVGRDTDIGRRKPSTDNWYDVAIGGNGYHIFLNIIGKKILKIGLYVYDKETFERLELKKQEIEAMCGFALDWYSSRESSTQKRILYSINTDIYNEENQKYCYDWLIKHSDKLKLALHTYDPSDIRAVEPKVNIGNTLTKDMAEVAYRIAKKVYLGDLGRTEGRNEIVKLTGMNEGSAGDYVTDFLGMMNGEQYARTLNEYSTRYFLDNILKDFGIEYLKSALLACKKHAKYYASLGRGRLAYVERLVEEFEKFIK